MATRQRPKQDHIGWSAAWLGLTDKQGDRVGEWAEHGMERTFRCRWCDKVGLLC